MNLNIKRDEISFKEKLSNAALDKQIRKSFKIHDFREMNARLSRMSNINTNNRSTEQKKSQLKQAKNSNFHVNLIRSVIQAQNYVQTGPHSIELKPYLASQANRLFGSSRGINNEQKGKNNSRDMPLLRKLRTYGALNGKRNTLTDNVYVHEPSNPFSRKKSPFKNDKIYICIQEMNQISRLSQKLTRAQICATQKLQTQQPQRVSIFQQEELKSSQARLSQIRRKELVFDLNGEKKILINHRSFSPVNFRLKNYFGQIGQNKKDKKQILKEKIGYLSVKGESKSIQNFKGQPKSRKNRPVLQKIQHQIFTVNSANLLEC